MRNRDNELERLADIFGALSHPLRLRLVRTLMHYPMCVSRLAAALDTPQPTISRNLAILRRAGVVKREQCRAFVRYELADSAHGVPLAPLRKIVALSVPDTYNEEATESELRRRGTKAPARPDAQKSKAPSATRRHV